MGLNSFGIGAPFINILSLQIFIGVTAVFLMLLSATINDIYQNSNKKPF